MAEGKNRTKPFCSTSPPFTSEVHNHGVNRNSDPSHPCPNGQAGQGSVSAPGPKPQAETSQEALAEAPSNSWSKVDEATAPPKRNRKRNGKQEGNSITQDHPTFEDLFGINSDSWTRFFLLNGTGDLNNLDIYEELNKKLKDDFDCIRRRDGSVMIDAKTRRNAIEVEKLQKIQNKDVNTARDPRLNSIRGTILVTLSEFKNEENLEERIQGHLQQQNIPISNVTVFKKNSRKGNKLTCACITFESRSVPASVRVGFEKVKVK